ncbi:MAG TPA: 6-bladed beta-propeller [Bryobacteraceae bacterium]|nr:6-bladed beta-propeller [Bryobacteraceae bacterium]
MPRFRAYVLFTLLAIGAAAQIKKKPANPADPPKLGDQRTTAYFDIGKIVWPNPPAVARIKFVDLRTGEKVDPKLFTSQKPKQKWMDRLAGAKAVDQIDTSKLPFQLIRTYGVAVDSKGTIYAADQGVGAIFLFDKSGGVKLIKNGVDAHFGLIDGLAMDDNDRLFVSDIKLNRVLVFDAQHKLEGSIGGDVLNGPGGVAIDTENRLLYVVDTGNDLVRVYDADTFKPLRTIGVQGKKHTLTDPGTFALPTNVAVDGDGNVYVTDTLNNRVEIFDADGEFISAFGKNGDGAGQFERPKGIAVDCDGHIWVVDAAQDRVKVFNREGQLLIYFGEHGEYPGRFMGAYGIAIDKENRVIVSETFPGRIQIFHYVNDAEAEGVRKAQVEGTKAAARPPAK